MTKNIMVLIRDNLTAKTPEDSLNHINESLGFFPIEVSLHSTLVRKWLEYPIVFIITHFKGKMANENVPVKTM